MHPDSFVQQDRGPYRFDRWQWSERVPTSLGDLIVELATGDGEPPPDAAMAAAANELAEFAAANGDLLLDLIYGHYRYAEENGWLSFWGVKPGLGLRPCPETGRIDHAGSAARLGGATGCQRVRQPAVGP